MRLYSVPSGILWLVLSVLFSGGMDARDTQRAGGIKIKPVPIKKVSPDYPRKLRQTRVEGQVIVEFVVSDIGYVKTAHAVRSTHAGFEEAAVNAVKQWWFEPGSIGGASVESRLQIPIIFKLSEDYFSTTLFEIPPIERPFRYDTMPKMRDVGDTVYPFPALLKNSQTAVSCVISINAEGRIGAVTWSEEVDEEFKGAIEAMLDTAQLTPAKRYGEAVEAVMIQKLVFNPYDGDVKVTDSAAAILKRLRTEGEDVVFSEVEELDASLVEVDKTEPIFPRRIATETHEGDAVIEYFVDQKGHTQLPHVISASEPAFGYAACQAISEWTYKPPLKDGKPVVVSVRVPVKFKGKNISD